MNQKKEGRRREEARSTPPRSRSTRRSSTIGLESPVPVYGSGVRCFEQQADQVEASGRALDTVFEHARGNETRDQMKIEILENRSCSKGEETEDERSRDRNIDDRKEEEEEEGGKDIEKENDVSEDIKKGRLQRGRSRKKPDVKKRRKYRGERKV